jgi:hypothetical protein
MHGYLTRVEAGWLLAAVSAVSHLGGSKARGLGAVELKPTRVEWWRSGSWQEDKVEALIEEALHGAT